MDKEKQIEELAYVLYKYGQSYDDCVDGAEYNIAKHLVNAGYRKINDDEVVIGKEEYKNDFSNQFNKSYKNGCNIVESIYDIPHNEVPSKLPDVERRYVNG